MNQEYKNNYDDPYNESNPEEYHPDRIITFFQIFLGLLSLSGIFQVLYVNCSRCHEDCSRNKKIKRKIKDDELLLTECIICLENYKKGDKISILSCDHYYHTDCLNEWLNKKEECPLCRIEI
jgi:hypothetical protein